MNQIQSLNNLLFPFIPQRTAKIAVLVPKNDNNEK